ncbi:MAG: DUF86 domain-containing protein [Thermodesulfobacteriota bacterium]
MSKDPSIFIDHILECIGLIEKYTSGKTESDFLNSPQLQDAVIRRIEIIGEAVKNIPENLKIKYPNIPRKKISGTRDILVHEYFGVDLKMTWTLLAKDIPELKIKMRRIKKEIN